MTEKDIKPIPKYILRMIEREDKNEFPVPSKQLRFYAYLTKYRGELVKVTVAVKHYRSYEIPRRTRQSNRRRKALPQKTLL